MGAPMTPVPIQPTRVPVITSRGRREPEGHPCAALHHLDESREVCAFTRRRPRRGRRRGPGRPRIRVASEQCTAPDRKSTRLNSSHITISYAVFCLKKKKKK